MALNYSKCPNCGSQIPEGNDYCNLCGLNYKEYLAKQQAGQRQQFAPIQYKIGIILALVFSILGGIVALFATIFAIDESNNFFSIFPIILPLIIIIFIAVFSIAKQKRK